MKVILESINAHRLIGDDVRDGLFLIDLLSFRLILLNFRSFCSNLNYFCSVLLNFNLLLLKFAQF